MGEEEGAVGQSKKRTTPQRIVLMKLFKARTQTEIITRISSLYSLLENAWFLKAFVADLKGA